MFRLHSLKHVSYIGAFVLPAKLILPGVTLWTWNVLMLHAVELNAGFKM